LTKYPEHATLAFPKGTPMLVACENPG